MSADITKPVKMAPTPVNTDPTPVKTDPTPVKNAPRTVKNSPRIRSIQEFRALASLMVVLAHTGTVAIKYCHVDNLAMRTFIWFGPTGVDFFFLISGFVIYQVSVGKLGNPRNALEFLYRRIARIYPIYWFYSLIVLAVYLYNPLLVNSEDGHHIRIMDSFLLIPQQQFPLLLQGWTLSYEVYFYLIFAVIIAFVTRRYVHRVLVLWAFLIVVFSRLLTHGSAPLYRTLELHPLVLEFLAGAFLCSLLHRKKFTARAGMWMVLVSLLYIAAVVSYVVVKESAGFDGSVMLYSWVRVLTFSPAYAVLILGVVTLELTGRLSKRPFVEAIGDWSYSIYLAHTLVINGLFRAATEGIPALISPYGVVLLGVIGIVLSVGVGHLSYVYLEKPMLRFTSHLLDLASGRTRGNSQMAVTQPRPVD